MMPSSVDFPQPDGPRMARNSSGSAARVTSSRAVSDRPSRPRYVLPSPSTTTRIARTRPVRPQSRGASSAANRSSCSSSSKTGLSMSMPAPAATTARSPSAHSSGEPHTETSSASWGRW